MLNGHPASQAFHNFADAVYMEFRAGIDDDLSTISDEIGLGESHA
jgi:hypothetical protein